MWAVQARRVAAAPARNRWHLPAVADRTCSRGSSVDSRPAATSANSARSSALGSSPSARTDASAAATARCHCAASGSASYSSTDTSTASALRCAPTKTAASGDRRTRSSTPASPARNSRNDTRHRFPVAGSTGGVGRFLSAPGATYGSELALVTPGLHNRFQRPSALVAGSAAGHGGCQG